MRIFLDTARYKAFLVAAETRSFTKAAELLCYTPSGVSQLINAFEKEFEEVPFLIENDRWNIFACESNSWGAVSVCGTGSSMAVKGKDGQILSSRALRYMLGNYGGGNHLTEIALHFAFRCDEHTGDYTRLAEEIGRAHV